MQNSNDSLPTFAFFYGNSTSANFGFPLSNIPLNINVNNATNGGVLKGETFKLVTSSSEHDQRIHKQSEATDKRCRRSRDCG